MKFFVFFFNILNIVFADYQSLSGYTPVSDVVMHSKIDLDLKMINDYLNLNDYNNSMYIYMNGFNSIKSSGSTRTLQGFSTSSGNKMINEWVYQLYASYYNDTNYADTFIHSIYNSNYDSVIKQELIMKGIQYQNVWMYIIHELEDAITDCIAGDLTLNDGGPHAWDEAWAFYSGSLEDGSGNGYSCYALAEKRSKNFGTESVNNELLNLYKLGSVSLIQMQCNNIIKIKNDIIKYLFIPLIQGYLKYLYKAETVKGLKDYAERYIFAKTILPIIDSCDSGVSNIVKSTINFNSLHKYSFKYIKQQLESVYSCLNITCNDIGGLLSYNNEYYLGMEPCLDLNENTLNENEVIIEGYVFPVWAIILIVVLFNLIMIVLTIGLVLSKKKYKLLKKKYDTTLTSTNFHGV